MEASPVKIFQYFNGDKQSLTPLFQRPYSWSDKNWKTLWDDIMLQYDVVGRSTHFMGAVVSVPATTVPIGISKHLIIDGQQRLTTLSLLLAAIRTKVTELGQSNLALKIDSYLTNPYEEAPEDLKLVPTQTDREAYKALILRLDMHDYEDSNIYKAYQYFLNLLAGNDDEGDPIVAKTVLDVITQALQVVMINLGNTDDPYLIFESLNHKGEPPYPV